MADDRYGGYCRREGWRERDSSIFSDDDDRWDRGSGRWSSEYGRGRGGGGDDRGFFERAGDEVRSWFGDEEAERRREIDVRRDESRGYDSGGDWRSDRGPERSRFEGGRGGSGGIRGGYGFSSQSCADWEHGGRERAGWGSGFGGGQDFDRGTGSQMIGTGRGEQIRQGFGGGRSHWDDNYRRWRDQQIQQFDREYDDYCRERQQQFDQDFDSWRTSRLTEGGSGGTGTTFQGAGLTDTSGDTTRTQGKGSGTSRTMGSQSAGTTSGGGGTGSAIGSGTGSTGAAAETGSTIGAGGSSGRSGGRGGRSRS